MYLDAYPLPEYAIYGAVPLPSIKRALRGLEGAGRLHRVRMVLLTNCTFDGIVYNPLPLVEEVLAMGQISASCGTKLAFAPAVPHARQRTAPLLEQRLASAESAAKHRCTSGHRAAPATQDVR